MKTLSKAFGATALAASILLAGGGIALAHGDTATTVAPADRQILLDFTGTQVSDIAGTATRAGLPFLPGTASFVASAPITAEDGTGQWRELMLPHCGVSTTFFLPEPAVLHDEPIDGRGHRSFGFGLQDSESLAWAQETYTSVATLKPHAALYGSGSLLATPVFYSGAAAPVMPVGEVFADAAGEKWHQVFAPVGLKTLMVHSSDVLEIEPFESANCGGGEGVAGAAAVEADIRQAARDAVIYSKLKAAAVAAATGRDANAEVSK